MNKMWRINLVCGGGLKPYAWADRSQFWFGQTWSILIGQGIFSLSFQIMLWSRWFKMNLTREEMTTVGVLVVTLENVSIFIFHPLPGRTWAMFMHDSALSLTMFQYDYINRLHWCFPTLDFNFLTILLLLKNFYMLMECVRIFYSENRWGTSLHTLSWEHYNIAVWKCKTSSALDIVCLAKYIVGKKFGGKTWILEGLGARRQFSEILCSWF